MREAVEKDGKRLLQEQSKVTEVYQGKKGGFLEIVKQEKNERDKNLTTYKQMADNGGKYTLLERSNIDGVKDPDAFNYKTGAFSDAKHPVTLIGKNAIQNSLKEANKQKVSEVVIRLENDYPSKDLYEGFKAGLQAGRADNLKTIVLIRKGQKPIYLEVEKMQKRLKRK